MAAATAAPATVVTAPTAAEATAAPVLNKAPTTGAKNPDPVAMGII